MTGTGSFTDALGQDPRQALRAMRAAPGYATTVVSSLALAIGAAASAFGVIDAVRFRALPFKDADRLVLIDEVPVATDAGPASARTCGSGCQVSYVTFDKTLTPYPFRTLDAVAGWTSGLKSYSVGGEVMPVQGGVVSRNVFDLLGVKPARGRTFTPDDDRLGATPTVVLSHDMWVDRFASDPNILGRVVKLSDTPYTVIGVMPAGFDHEAGSLVWLPAVPTLDPSTRPSIRSLTVVGRLRPGATIEQARAELASIEPVAISSGGTAPQKTRLEVLPLRARYTSSTQSHDLIFAAIVGCILLIATANLANLTLVRTLHQQRELAIRTSLGASAARLARHLLMQQLVMVLLATTLGLLLAHWTLGALSSLAVLNSIRPTGMEYRLDLRVAGFATALALLIAGLLSAVPSRLIAAVDPQLVMRDGAPTTSGSRWGNRTQRVFVVAQIASAVVLLSGAALMAKTVWYLSGVDLGFSVGAVLQGTPSFPHPWRVRGKFVPVTREIGDALARLPGVSSAAVRASVALAPRSATTGVTLRGQSSPLPPSLAPRAAYSVTPSYFETLGVPMARGRSFLSSDAERSVPVAIVNEWAARRWWPGGDPIGETIQIDVAPAAAGTGDGASGVGTIGRITLTVVGVVRDNKAALPNLLLADVGPEIYRPYEQAPTAFPTFFVRASGAPAPLLRSMRDVLVRLVPDRPTFATLVSQNVATQLRGVRTNALQIVGFAVVGLLLAVMGIYGVFSYTVSRRTREIGIRGALGASRATLRGLVLGDALRLTAIGLAIGLPAAAAATRVIASLLHGTSPTDVPAYLAVALGVVVVSLGASWLPARRAARVDPIVALRSR